MNAKAQIHDSRYNNFNLVRLLAAICVIVGHMGHILGIPAVQLGSANLHQIGVQVLFVIGGYLIANSWKNDPHPIRYLVRRFLRLWPPFAVMILLVTFVLGPALSSLGAAGYFHSWWKIYLNNLRFYIIFAQPGMFENNPMPYVTNGSLWTMPVEALLYLLTPVIMLALSQPKKGKYSFVRMLVLALLFIAGDLYLIGHPEFHVVFYATDWVAGFHLMTYFVIGMLFSFEEIRPVLKFQAAPLALLVLLLTTQFIHSESIQLAWLLTLPYLVFSFALVPDPMFSRFGTKFELSYGIYLYGFVFQQIVVQWNMKYQFGWGFAVCLALSLLLTVAAAFVNCVLVENPMLRMTKKITRAMRGKKSERT